MNPRPFDEADPDRVERRLYCPDYGACLDLAVSGGWPGFTCRECGRREIEPPPPGEYDACYELVRAVVEGTTEARRLRVWLAERAALLLGLPFPILGERRGLGTREAAAVLGVRVELVRELVNEGELRALRRGFGGGLRIKAESLMEWLKTAAESAPAENMRGALG